VTHLLANWSVGELVWPWVRTLSEIADQTGQPANTEVAIMAIAVLIASEAQGEFTNSIGPFVGQLGLCETLHTMTGNAAQAAMPPQTGTVPLRQTQTAVSYLGCCARTHSPVQSTTIATTAPRTVSPIRSPARTTGSSGRTAPEIRSASGVMKIRAKP
jgi:hypothetical protein